MHFQQIRQIKVLNLGSKLFIQVDNLMTPRDGLAHAETELRVVFEQGVSPSRTLSLGVDGVGEGWIGAAPDGRAAWQKLTLRLIMQFYHTSKIEVLLDEHLSRMTTSVAQEIKWTNQGPVALAMINRSPNSWVMSFT